MISGGPKIETDGLVLSLNASDYKSYKGESTTNILAYPEKNGRFTSENTWGTYNTDNYNSGVAFTLTLSSITNDIATFSYEELSTLDTYDIVRPQSTGGGLSSSSDYFLKKHGSGQFSFHIYNSSQDGTQGYINPTTGYHKVHDSIWLDQKVAISSSGFPSSFRCIAHKPNKSIVKELVINRGRIKGTNCMRIHRNRDVLSSGGMSYGVGSSVTLNDSVTVSYWAKASDPRGIGKTYNFQAYFGGGVDWYIVSETLTADWKLYERTFNANATINMVLYWILQANVLFAMDICDIQVELNKGYSTPFTTSSRSNANIWLDRSGNNNHGTAVNGAATKVTHYQYGQTIAPKSAAYIEFDGTNDYISVPSVSMGNPTTVMMFFKLNALGSEQALFGPSANANDNWISVNSANKIKLFATQYAEVGNFNIYGETVLTTSNWYHVAAIINGNSAYLFLNGELENSTTLAYTIGSWTGTSKIGMRGNGTQYPLNGKVANVNIYNRALSATEIRNQYSNSKSKFL